MAQTSGVDISFREGYANFSAGEALDGRTLAILAHEMVHVTQYRRNRELAPWYVPGWLADQQLRARHQSGALEREKPWEIPAYRISDRAEKDFGSGPLDPCNCSL